jgi:hypothetical protein
MLRLFAAVALLVMLAGCSVTREWGFQFGGDWFCANDCA